ncbi:DUF4169 family protein [Sphingobium sp. Cam5-1]|uniref:DUF4169 family protein n=1 Tax=Sphingobium sp. Cam5-1 TaxID=2789327 RepID=UPI0018AD187B|nr:DUF4169 family protein [Sphingobium sp. Cam5-1]QPI72059.1 DUF4169 family protein [Sphingobium sp. Cam5-1]
MADIINLRQARKARARKDKEKVAAANRARFGQTKAEREVRRIEDARQDRVLDGSRRDSDVDPVE